MPPDHDLYIFDVDGTLVTSQPRGEYGKVEVLPRRLAVIRKLAEEGASFALATNQPQVALGERTEREVAEKILEVARLVFAPAETFCDPHVCMEPATPRYKPEPGMLLEAIKVHSTPPGRAIFIGDHKTDEEAAQAAGIDFDYAEHFFNHGVRLHAA